MVEKFEDLVEDPMGFGMSDLKLNTVHLSKHESCWGEDEYIDDLREYVISSCTSWFRRYFITFFI